jgi:hypothetical protein
MEKLPIIIYRFYTVYDEHPVTKEPRARDMVEYGPIGQAGRTQVVERIDILRSVQAVAGANPAVHASRAMWEFIKPRYEAWKSNQELPETGTPLAAWNHLTPQQAEILRVNGVRSVEDCAQLTDTHINRIPIPNLRSIIEAAKKFLDHKDVNRFDAEMKAKDDQLAAANTRIDEMAGMLAKLMQDQPAKRGPGRPPKTEEAAA